MSEIIYKLSNSYKYETGITNDFWSISKSRDSKTGSLIKITSVFSEYSVVKKGE